MAARPYFDEELSRLKQGMIEMGELVKEAIDGSFEAVRSNNKTKAYLVSENDVLINKKEREIESLCISLLLREQPVATDLRQITAALKMITDLERIGDQAAEICEITTTLPEGIELSGFDSLSEMASKTYSQVQKAIDSYVFLDLATVKECIAGDKAINTLFDQTKEEILDHIITYASDENYMLEVLLIAKYLERIGDHVVNIAEWVEYAITRIHKGNKVGIEQPEEGYDRE